MIGNSSAEQVTAEASDIRQELTSSPTKLTADSPSAAANRERMLNLKNRQQLGSAQTQKQNKGASGAKQQKGENSCGQEKTTQQSSNKTPTVTIGASSSPKPASGFPDSHKHQKQQKEPRFSIFDQLEEFQFQSYEMGSKLKSLIEVILMQQNSNDGNQYLIQNVPPEDWLQIKQLSLGANSVFESMQTALGNFFERMQDEISKWKRRCGRLQYKVQHYQNFPPSGSSKGKSQKPSNSSNSGKHNLILSSSGRKLPAGSGAHGLKDEPTSPYNITAGARSSLIDRRRLNRHNIMRKDADGKPSDTNLIAHGEKHSLSSSCNPAGGNRGSHNQLKLTQHQNQLLQQSWLDIANVYDKNRTQMNSFMDEMEMAVHELRHAREKLNVKHLGTMTTVEQDMEALLQDVTTARSHHSQVSNNVTHRSSARGSRSHMLLGANSAHSTKQSKQHNSVQTTGKKAAQKYQQQQYQQAMGRELETSGGITIMRTDQKVRGKSHSGIHQSEYQHLNLESELDDAKIGHARGSKGLVVPPLPIHMINQKTPSALPEPPPAYEKRPLSSRRHPSAQKPPQPSHRGISYRSNSSAQRRESARARVNSNNVTGAIVEGALVNPVFVNAAGGNLSSRFDPKQESDYDSGCDATLVLDTERLKQFPDEYQVLAGQTDEDKRILLKQVLFMKYEREIKKQLKAEKQQRKKEKKGSLVGQMRSRQPNAQHNRSRQGSNTSYSSIPRSQPTHARDNGDIELQAYVLGVSGMQLESSLSQLGTGELASGMKDAQMKDARLSQLLNMDHEISGLLTVTQRELIEMVDKDLQLQQDLRKENRKVLDWSSAEEEREKDPNQVAMHVDTSDLQHGQSTPSDSRQQPVVTPPINRRQNNYVGEQSSFQNDSSLMYDERTPSLREITDYPDSQNAFKAQAQKDNITQGYSSLDKVPGEIEIIDNMMAEDVDESYDEESFFNQKKSLEIITERQSEFSNTNGTTARLISQRSKKQPYGGSSKSRQLDQNSIKRTNRSSHQNSGSGKKLTSSVKQLDASSQNEKSLGFFHSQSARDNIQHDDNGNVEVKTKLSIPSHQAHKLHQPPDQYRNQTNDLITAKPFSQQSQLSSHKSRRKQNVQRFDADDQQSYVDTSFIEEQTEPSAMDQISSKHPSPFPVPKRNTVPKMISPEQIIYGQNTTDISPTKRLFRSNSDPYLKPVDDMQDPEEQFIMPIAYAVDAAGTISGSDLTQQVPHIMIDSSQMNNLIHDYSNASFNNIVNQSVCLRLQRLFMQAHFSASRSRAGSIAGTAAQPIIMKPSGKTGQSAGLFVGTANLNRSNFTGNAPQHVHRKTIQMMLESGYQSQFTQKGVSMPNYIPWTHHSNNQVAGLLFSSAIVSNNTDNTPGRVINGSASVAPGSQQNYLSSEPRFGIGAFSDQRRTGAQVTTNTTSSLIKKLAAESQHQQQLEARRKSIDELVHYKTSHTEDQAKLHSAQAPSSQQKSQLKLKTSSYHSQSQNKQVVLHANRIKAPKLNIQQRTNSANNRLEQDSPLNYSNGVIVPQLKSTGLNQSSVSSKSTGVIKRANIRKIPVKRILETNSQQQRNATNISIQSAGTSNYKLKQKGGAAPGHATQQKQIQSDLIQQFLQLNKQQQKYQQQQQQQSQSSSEQRKTSERKSVNTLLQKKQQQKKAQQAAQQMSARSVGGDLSKGQSSNPYSKQAPETPYASSSGQYEHQEQTIYRKQHR